MATSVSERLHLLTLPLELISTIWEHLDRKSLKNLRVASKTCRGYSTQPLFESFTVYPHVRSFERLIELSKQPHIAEHVEELQYDTILLGLTEMIIRRFDSVYSAQISVTERKKVSDHARRLENQCIRADAPFDELAQLSYLEQVLPRLPKLRAFTVIDATGFREPSCQLVNQLPHFYQQLVDETCGRFEHTRLERGMYGTPRCTQGSYSRPVIMALHKAPKPVERLILRGIRWPALLSSHITKHTLLLDNVLANIKHFEIMQSYDTFFPGPICMVRLQQILCRMVNLEKLELYFCHGFEVKVPGLDIELPGALNEARCQSYFSGLAVSTVGGPLPGRLNWSSKLHHLTLSGMICSSKEMRSLLRHCAGSLKELELGDIVLTPDITDGSRSCLVDLIKWIHRRLSLERNELFGRLSNGGMQNWLVDPTLSIEETELLSAQVHRYILTGGSCPLDDVAIPPDYYDLGKRSRTNKVPESFESEAFTGDASWQMFYEDEEEPFSDDSDWTDDDDGIDLLHDLHPDSDLDSEHSIDDMPSVQQQVFAAAAILADAEGFVQDAEDYAHVYH